MGHHPVLVSLREELSRPSRAMLPAPLSCALNPGAAALKPLATVTAELMGLLTTTSCGGTRSVAFSHSWANQTISQSNG